LQFKHFLLITTIFQLGLVNLI